MSGRSREPCRPAQFRHEYRDCHRGARALLLERGSGLGRGEFQDDSDVVRVPLGQQQAARSRSGRTAGGAPRPVSLTREG